MPLQLHIDNNGHWFVDTELGGVQVGNAYQQTDGSWVVTVNECILEAPDLHSAMRIFADNYDRSLVQLSPMTDGDNWDCEEDESEVTIIDLSSLDRPSDLRMQEAEDFMTTTAEVSHQAKAPQALPEEPKLQNFPDEESFLEARDSWRHRVMPIVRLAQSTLKRRSGVPPTMATFTSHDEVVGAHVPARQVTYLEQATPGVGAKITVKWGYDLHSIILTPKNWAKIKSGKSLSIRGKGYWYEGECFWDRWSFGGGLGGSLEVTYGDDGGVGFTGMLSDAIVEECATHAVADRRSC